MEEVFVPGLAKTSADVFNALAMFFNSPSWEAIMTISFIVSGFAVLFMVMKKGDWSIAYYWLVSLLLIPALTTTGKDKIVITNMSVPLEFYVVENVPTGISIPAVYISNIMYGTQEALEDIFHTPNDTQYAKTGMIYTAKLFQESNKMQMSPQVQTDFNNFLERCIMPDISAVRSAYSWSQLFAAPDIFVFLEENMTKGLFDHVKIGTENKLVSCSEARGILQEEVKKDSDLAITTLATSTMLDDLRQPIEKKIEMQNSIQSVYTGLFSKNSMSSQAQMMQNLSINALKNGVNAIKSKSNLATQLNYSQTQTMMSSMSNWYSLGMQMAEVLPMMNTVLFLLICCYFIPAMMLIMIPGWTFKIASKYVTGLLWVSSWGIGFVFINFIFNSILESQSNQLFLDLPLTAQGFSLNMQDSVAYQTYKWSAIAGYLMVFIPFLSRGVVSGFPAVMGSLATSFTNTMLRSTEVGSNYMSTGDLQLFNTGIGNHSGNNHSFNKTDMSSYYKGAENSERVLESGGSMRTTGDGRDIVDSRGSENQSFAKAQFSSSVSTQMQESEQQSWTSTETTAANFSKTLDNASSYDMSHQSQNSISTQEGLDKLDSIAKSNGFSSSVDGSSGLSGGVRGSAAFKMFGTGVEAYTDGSIGVKGNSGQWTKLSGDDSQAIKDTMSSMQSSNQNVSEGFGSKEAASVASSLSDSFTDSMSFSKIRSDIESQSGAFSVDYSSSVIGQAMQESGLPASGFADANNALNPEYVNAVNNVASDILPQLVDSYKQGMSPEMIKSNFEQHTGTIDKEYGNLVGQSAKYKDDYGSPSDNYQSNKLDFGNNMSQAREQHSQGFRGLNSAEVMSTTWTGAGNQVNQQYSAATGDFSSNNVNNSGGLNSVKSEFNAAKGSASNKVVEISPGIYRADSQYITQDEMNDARKLTQVEKMKEYLDR